jgi:predicted PolB exonuclease-like 3'-5' exonuclease
MLRLLPEKVVCFDCEWCPDPASGRILYRLSDSLSDREVVEEMWGRNGATADNPQPFLKTVLCRVLSIAGMARTATSDGITVSLFSLPTDVTDPRKASEAHIIQNFLKKVGDQKRQLVGFNSIASDLRILSQRALIHGLSVPSFFLRPIKPWEGFDYFASDGQAHVDLSDRLSGYGSGRVSLNEIATLSGIPGKMDVSGAQVPDLWMDGKYQEIVNYNEFDAVTTYLLWLRLVYISGLLTDEEVKREESAVRHELERQVAQGKGHLNDYLLEWDRLAAATSLRFGRGTVAAESE